MYRNFIFFFFSFILWGSIFRVSCGIYKCKKRMRTNFLRVCWKSDIALWPFLSSSKMKWSCSVKSVSGIPKVPLISREQLFQSMTYSILFTLGVQWRAWMTVTVSCGIMFYCCCQYQNTVTSDIDFVIPCYIQGLYNLFVSSHNLFLTRVNFKMQVIWDE